MAAINLFVLLFFSVKDRTRPYFPLLQSALAGMGILDLFHAISLPGESFIWLHSIAVFTGGFFFSLVCLPERLKRTISTPALPLTVTLISTVFGCISYFFPQAVPDMFSGQRFTRTASLINAIGGVLFIAASIWFFRHYFHYRRRFDEILFGSLCLLSGISGLIFDYSSLWDLPWWGWHIMRLFSYGLALSYFYAHYQRTEHDLVASEQRYRTLVETSPNLIYIFSFDRGGILYSRRAEEILGYSPQELLANPYIWRDSIHPDDLASVTAALNGAEAGKSFEVIYRIRDRAGSWHWFQDRFNKTVRDSGEVLIEGIAIDITDIKHFEAERTRLLARLEAQWEIAQMVDADHRVLSGRTQELMILLTGSRYSFFGSMGEDEQVMSAYAWSRDVMENCSIPDRVLHFSVEQAGIWANAIRERRDLIINDMSADIPNKRGLPEGHVELDNLMVIPVFRAGKIVAVGAVANKAGGYTEEDARELKEFLSSVQLLIDRRQAGEKLVMEKGFSETLLNAQLDTVFLFDPANGSPVRWNSQFAQISGYSHEEIAMLKAPDSYYDAEDLARAMDAVADVVATGQGRVELDLVTKSGKRVPFEYLVRTIEAEDGRALLLSIGRDLTERRCQDEALRESENSLKEAQKMAKLGYWKWDIASGDVEWSEEVYQIFGLESATFTPQIESILALSPWPEDSQRDRELIRRSIETREPGSYEQRFLLPDGSTGYYFSTFRGIFDAAGNLTTMVGVVQDITERRRSEEVLRKKDELLRLTCEMAEVGGWEFSPETMQGTWTDEVARIHDLPPEDRTSVEHGLSFYPPESRPLIEEAVRGAVEDGRPYDLELEFLSAKGVRKWVRTIGRPVLEGGRVVRVSGTIQDVTKRRVTEESLRHFSETQTVLFREVNHRVKNNLAAIISLLHKEGDRAKKDGVDLKTLYLDDMVKRIEGLLVVHQLLSSTGWQPLDLAGLCKAVIGGILEPYPETCKLSVTPSVVRIDSDQAHNLTLVLNELATNSLKYGRSDDRMLHVTVEITENDGVVSIRYHDNGPGFPEGILGGGHKLNSGIGFDVMFGIVKKTLRGTLELHNDFGATAQIMFPVAQPGKGDI